MARGFNKESPFETCFILNLRLTFKKESPQSRPIQSVFESQLESELGLEWRLFIETPCQVFRLLFPGLEVSTNCNKKEVILACTDYPFIFKASGKKEVEESEEAMRNSTLAEESEERPEGKRCQFDVS